MASSIPAASSQGVQQPSNIRTGFARAIGAKVADKIWGLRIVSLFLVLIAILGVAAFAYFNWEFTKGAFRGIGVSAYTWLQQQSPEFALGLAQAYAAIKNPEEEYTRQQLRGDAPVKSVKARREIVVKGFGAQPNVFRSGKPIYLNLEVVGKNPVQDTRLSGMCSFEGGKGNLGLKSSRESYVATILFDGNTDVLEGNIAEQHAYGKCVFPDGAFYQANDFVKKVMAKIRYRASSVSFWKFYYIHSDYRRENPRALIKDVDMKSDGSMKTTPEYEAAMSIGFGAEPQPYYEDRERVLTLLFFRNTGVDGSLEKLHSLKILAPLNFAFIEDEQCDFEQMGSDEEGNVEYVVKQESLKEVDIDCGNAEIAKGILGRENCERIYKNDLGFTCGFEVRDIDAALQSPQYGILKAVADYDFVTYGRTTIQVLEDVGAGGVIG